MKEILFLSNGYGEDMISAAIIEELKKREGFKFKALPLIGEGRECKSLNIEMIGPGKELPSGGFSNQGLCYLWKDIKAGLIKLTWEQIKALRKVREFIDLVVCVGDIYGVLLSLLFLRKPIIFLATAKSDYIGEHYGIEKWVMRNWCKLVFARDEITAHSLRKSGVKALFLGNAMRDCLKVRGEDFGLSESSLTLGLLPGSREEAYDNLVDILKVVEPLREVTPNFLLALAPSLNLEKVREKIKKIDWKLKEASPQEKNKGIVAKLSQGSEPRDYRELSTLGCRVAATFRLREKEVIVTQGRFGDVLNKSNLIIGLAGTANEQAAGLGKPVITFPGNGPQTTKKRLREQKRLLGDSLAFVRKEEAAAKIEEILKDESQMERMAKAGRERMGEPGGVQKIAEKISESIVLN